MLVCVGGVMVQVAERVEVMPEGAARCANGQRRPAPCRPSGALCLCLCATCALAVADKGVVAARVVVGRKAGVALDALLPADVCRVLGGLGLLLLLLLMLHVGCCRNGARAGASSCCCIDDDAARFAVNARWRHEARFEPDA